MTNLRPSPVLVVDAANVIGSRPNGWWRDRAGAARAFVECVRAAADAGSLVGSVVVVLEGQARVGAEEGTSGAVEVVHAPASGDDAIVALAVTHGARATVVTADRALGDRVRGAGATVVGPTWLLDRLPQ
ncbi:MAG: hypothetical protein WDA60_09760 [Acidimicrobiia bacterium]